MSTLVNTSSTEISVEISVVKQKHDELLKKSLLTRSQFEGQLKEKSKVISDLKVKEGKDIDTMIEMEKQIKFLNEILYKRNQSIQTIHMLAPKCATYNGRSTFANPKYLKKAQSDKPCLYEIPYDTSDPANRFAPDGEEIVTLAKESRSKLDKDTVKPYNYTYQNSLYETFKPPSKAYLDQLERAKEVRKTMWRKTFVRTKPNIAKNFKLKNFECKMLYCADYENDDNSDHYACFLDTMRKHLNARTKKPHVVPISASKPKRKVNKSIATPHKKIVASDTTIQKSKSYYKELTKKIWMPKVRKDDESTSISPTIDIVSRITNVLKISNSLGSNLSSVPSSSNSLADCTTHPIHCLVLHQMTSDLNRSALGIHDHSNEQTSSKLVPKLVPLAVKTATSRQELELLFYHHIAMLRTTGINPMIQPEPEDLPKDNPKLEIAVLRMKKKCMDKGSKERIPPHNLRQKPGQYICCQNHKLIADIENTSLDTVNAMHNLPTIRVLSTETVSFVTRDTHTISIDKSHSRLVDIE
ncbi:hypothetical protein Tco_0565704 [Tanacetum coccineum]